MRSITGLFGRSPFRPLAQHTEKVHDTIQLVRPLMEAFMDRDWARAEDVYRQISKLEHKADVVKTDIRDHLPSSLFMPVDRGDILLFLKEQDSIADAAEDVAVLVTMRNTPTPEPMKAGVLELVDRVLLVGETWFETAHELPLLEEASFTGPEVENVLARIQKISDLEWEADKQQAEMSRELIRNEAEIGAVSVLFWMRILSELGTIANKAENTADLLRLMLAKR
jgi:predicted phosphate transport protein (TIGR00153 family)